MSAARTTVLAIPVREFLKFKPKELLNGLKRNTYVQFEDGVCEYLTSKEIVANRYAYILVEKFPKLIITSKYNIKKYYKDNAYAAKSFNGLFEQIYRDIVNVYIKEAPTREDMGLAFLTMFTIFDKIYNEFVYSNLKYAPTIDIEDFMDIQENPELLASIAKAGLSKSKEDVLNTHQVLDKVIRNPIYTGNPLADGYRSGGINPNQVKQMLASIGHRTELNSRVYSVPIATSFTIGLDMYSFAIESRSGGKALFLSHVAIKNSEYSAREFQLVTLNIESLVDGDCGSTNYLLYYVKPKEENNGKSALNSISGMWYLDETENILKCVSKDDTHLEGTTIKLRAPSNCTLLNSRHICTKCFGELSYSVPMHSNIGNLSSTTSSKEMTQSILSTKHLTFSAVGSAIHMDRIAEQFFTIKNKSYCFKAGLIDRSVKTKYVMIVSQFDGRGIKDINKNIDIRKLNLSALTRLETVTINRITNGEVESFVINIKNHNTYGFFSPDFIAYIQSVGFTIDEYDRYNIDLSEWKKTLPVINMPDVEFSFLHLSNEYKHMFKFGTKEVETVESISMKAAELLNSKLDIPFPLINTTAYGFTAKDPNNGDYSLGRNTESPAIVKLGAKLENGSLGGSLAWEKVLRTIFNGITYDGRNAVDHPLDVLLKPNETIKDKYGGFVTENDIHIKEYMIDD